MTLSTIRDLEARCPEDATCINCLEEKYCTITNPSWIEVWGNIQKDPDKYWK